MPMRSSFTKRLPLVAYYVYRTILMTASRPRWHFQLAVLVDIELGVFFWQYGTWYKEPADRVGGKGSIMYLIILGLHRIDIEFMSITSFTNIHKPEHWYMWHDSYLRVHALYSTSICTAYLELFYDISPMDEIISDVIILWTEHFLGCDFYVVRKSTNKESSCSKTIFGLIK